MRGIDPRLLRYARSTRTFLYLSVALGTVAAVLIVAQAWLLAEVVAGAFEHGGGLRELRGPLVVLLCVVLARAVVAWSAELAAARSSARAKSQLRTALLERVAQVGLDSPREARTGELATLATRGIDALDGWFSLYLPQVVLAVIVPLAVLAAIFTGDWISGVIVAFTLPLIPLFMALVGATTRERMDLQVNSLQRLAGHFLDVVAGLPTLKVFGRAKAQAQSIREVSERYRTTALSTLRVTFLSSLILELVATVSVALVAVAIGLRLMSGAMGLQSALFVLVLAPEAYLPLRRLGANYHASAEGMAAAERVFAVLEAPLPPRGACTHVPNPALTGIAIEGLTIAYPGRGEPAVEDFSLTVEPGETVALAGPSGCGKSSVLSVLLGFLAPERGTVRTGDVELAWLDPDAWRERIAWMPQRPHLFAGSIADNVRIGREGASMEEIQAACLRAGLGRVEASLERGLATQLGDGGAGLSAGERQRVALARAFLRGAPLLLLDEPTASLDGETEEQAIAALRELCEGRTVVLVAHRPALLEMADRVVSIGALEAVA